MRVLLGRQDFGGQGTFQVRELLPGAGCGRSELRHSTVMRKAGRVFWSGEPHSSGGDKCRREDQLSREEIRNKEQWELVESGIHK